VAFEILGSANKNLLYCTGSFTKLLTTYVCLSRLAEDDELSAILDDDHFLDQICCTQASKDFLDIFQTIIGSRFSLRDVCSFYDGLPYTFDLSESELESVDQGNPFKHHSIMDENVFLEMCRTCITLVDPNRCKFHYSEISILFLGYLIEKIYDIKIEDLYQNYIIDAFTLRDSIFSRGSPLHVEMKDLSDKYDY
jgi:CubicO group peptidase (beta-lactamase class C family)